MDGTQLAAIFDKTVIVCWSYPSGEILLQKKLDEDMNRIEWNPFRPNVFAAFAYGVSCFFISNLFPLFSTCQGHIHVFLCFCKKQKILFGSAHGVILWTCRVNRARGKNREERKE